MIILIHGKQDYFSEEKPDIKIDLPDFTSSLVTRLVFKLRHLTK